jgi:hypothetical protein
MSGVDAATGDEVAVPRPSGGGVATVSPGPAPDIEFLGAMRVTGCGDADEYHIAPAIAVTATTAAAASFAANRLRLCCARSPVAEGVAEIASRRT